MADSVLLVYDEAMLGHNPTGWDPGHPEWTAAVKALLNEQYPDKDLSDFSHPERPQRLSAIIERLRAEPIDGILWSGPKPAAPAELERVHTRAHVDFIESLHGRCGWLDVDTTAVSTGSVTAAKLAAGAGITAVEAVTGGRAKRAFCAVRPPGHHASAERARGFCLYNNMAVSVAHARALGMERLLVWDWDLHHGNGTQDILYERSDVLFIDTHCAAPFYPGTGALTEIGAGAGTGYNLNVPLPGGSGNAALMRAFERIIRPAAEAYHPDMIFISAGFDSHYLDQSFLADETGFAALSAGMCAIADEFAQGRLVMCLEGGYNAQALSDSAHACISALAGRSGRNGMNVLQEDPGIAAVEEAALFHAGRLKRLAE